jgi:hypothetical protein
MPVVMLVAAGAVLAGVIVVALGRGGELAYFQPDYFPLKLEQISATDVALFRPPMALWGYNAQATDEALNRIATALTERDIEISALQQRVADLAASAGQQAAGPARGRDPGRPAEPPSGSGRLAATAEPPVSRPVAFGDDVAATRPPLAPPPFATQPPPGTRPARRPDPPFTRPARPDARARFGLPEGAEDDDE